jgi:hypothetical protein
VPGDADPMGETLKINGSSEFLVAGVIKDIPENSHFKFDILLSYDNLMKNSSYYDSYWVSEQSSIKLTSVLVTFSREAAYSQLSLPA